MKCISAVAAFLTFAIAASAVPSTSPAARDVWDPKILFPHSGVVWTSGQRQNVTWDLSSQPAQITNNNGFILLRQGGVETTLVVGHGFLLTDGHTEVTVPDVLGTSDGYSLVLFGDSGNWSEDFTIKGVIDV